MQISYFKKSHFISSSKTFFVSRVLKSLIHFLLSLTKSSSCKQRVINVPQPWTLSQFFGYTYFDHLQNFLKFQPLQSILVNYLRQKYSLVFYEWNLKSDFGEKLTFFFLLAKYCRYQHFTYFVNFTHGFVFETGVSPVGI